MNTEDYLPLVRKIAYKVKANVPPHVDINDLVSVGTIGLMQAAHKFDQTRGVKFETFAYKRIFGAIMDYIRKESKYANMVTSYDKANKEYDQYYDVISDLSQEEQQVLRLIYYSRNTLSEISKQLQCSPSRVWQIKKKSLEKIRKNLL